MRKYYAQEKKPTSVGFFLPAIIGDAGFLLRP